ncbi:MAG: hypothetical protein GKR89_35050 [Candidatus Latescibacteria bacterium]|nr:hypothetical protein [Candidatus Latescibacterota bacterium]
MFHLDRQIDIWRARQSASGLYRGEDIDELEEHLRATIEELQAGSLSQEEAFWVALHRLGHTQLLDGEFGHINTELAQRRYYTSTVAWAVAAALGVLAVGLLGILLIFMENQGSLARPALPLVYYLFVGVAILAAGGFIVRALVHRPNRSLSLRRWLGRRGLIG